VKKKGKKEARWGGALKTKIFGKKGGREKALVGEPRRGEEGGKKADRPDFVSARLQTGKSTGLTVSNKERLKKKHVSTQRTGGPTP